MKYEDLKPIGVEIKKLKLKTSGNHIQCRKLIQKFYNDSSFESITKAFMQNNAFLMLKYTRILFQISKNISLDSVSKPCQIIIKMFEAGSYVQNLTIAENYSIISQEYTKAKKNMQKYLKDWDI